jgi:hypothetical protein
MKRFALVPLLLMTAVLSGCNDPVDPPCRWPSCPVLSGHYVAPTSPENVISNMATLYINLDPAAYDSTLAPDYVFRFLPYDITAGQPDSLIRSEEMSFAQNLFINGAGEGSPKATRIQLVLETVSSEPDHRIGHATWVKCVVSTNLTVTFTNANPITVTGPAWWYFRQVPEGSGRWRLAEWVDRPPGRIGGAQGRVSIHGALVSMPTWGQLHRVFK